MESVCDDPEVIAANILVSILHSLAFFCSVIPAEERMSIIGAFLSLGSIARVRSQISYATP